MPPKHPIEKWNTKKTIKVNNCYNYATDTLQKSDHPKGEPTEDAHPGTPGLSWDGRRPWRVHPEVETYRGWEEKWELDCDLLAAALERDGLHIINDYCDDPNHKECWRVAFFIKKSDDVRWRPKYDDKGNPTGEWVRVDVDGYHFAREDVKATPATDSEPAKAAQWSHKCCADEGHAATEKVLVPDYDDDGHYKGLKEGNPITDPKKQMIKPGLIFCGYACCCPELIQVASISPESILEDKETTMVMYDYGDYTIIPPVDIPTVVFDRLGFDTITGNWENGFGPGRIKYRFDRLERVEQKAVVAVSYFVSSKSLTIEKKGQARYLTGSGKGFVEQVDQWLNTGIQDQCC